MTARFLGPTTAAIAAGVQPMGSVFSGVPSPDSLLGWDIRPVPPPFRFRPDRQAAARADGMTLTAPHCGCGA
jgi:hypothetical protein